MSTTPTKTSLPNTKEFTIPIVPISPSEKIAQVAVSGYMSLAMVTTKGRVLLAQHHAGKWHWTTFAFEPWVEATPPIEGDGV